MKTRIAVGGAAGFWGDAALATPQLIASGDIDFLVYDYLAEVTLSILARARAADDSKGYAVDFVSAAMAPNLKAIATGGVRVIANAGGVNPRACAEALRALIREQGLQLRVAVVLGDDLADEVERFHSEGVREMFSDALFPPPAAVASINAYLGAFPIAAALDAGADIVLTGRCVDSAVTLGACIHAFGWAPTDSDKLAQGSLAGHLIECGTQATGGNFTDWEQVADSLPRAGYPLAFIAADGTVEIGKPAGSGGLVSVGTVAEQMLYEIGDPRRYLLPDVVCDFSEVVLEQVGDDRVRVSGARGHGAPAAYKACATWADGFRAGQLWTMVGRDAETKARLFASGVLERTAAALEARGLPPLSESSVEILGAESHFGAAARGARPREVDLKLAVKHPEAGAVALFLKEMVGLALTAPPGLTSFAGARPKPSPVVRLFSFLVPREAVPVRIELEGEPVPFEAPALPAEVEPGPAPPVPLPEAAAGERLAVPLEQLAFGRSGDKGDKANIGIIARHASFVPWLAEALTVGRVARCFEHFLAPGQAEPVECFYLPGTGAFNYLLHGALGGGGVASLRADPQGKCYAQLLLAETVPVPRSLADAHGLTAERQP